MHSGLAGLTPGSGGGQLAVVPFEGCTQFAVRGPGGCQGPYGVQPPVDPLVSGPTDQDLTPHWKAHYGLCQAHELAMVLYLACHMVHLSTCTGTERRCQDSPTRGQPCLTISPEQASAGLATSCCQRTGVLAHRLAFCGSHRVLWFTPSKALSQHDWSTTTPDAMPSHTRDQQTMTVIRAENQLFTCRNTLFQTEMSLVLQHFYSAIPCSTTLVCLHVCTHACLCTLPSPCESG